MKKQPTKKTLSSGSQGSRIGKAAAISTAYADVLDSLQKAAATLDEVGHPARAYQLRRCHGELESAASEVLSALEYADKRGLVWRSIVVVLVVLAAFGASELLIYSPEEPRTSSSP